MAEYVQAKAKGAHTPTLDLVASGTQTKDPNSFTSVERSGGVSLRLTVPIFEGGRTDAEVKRVFALREQAYQELRTARREAEVKTAEAFLGMANATGKSRALEQALHAAKTSLRGARIGRETGLRTHTEVLNAQQQVFTVERDLNKERYNHALAALQLKALAGDLVDADVADLTIKPVNEQ
jgi:outer membrane protein TolC